MKERLKKAGNYLKRFFTQFWNLLWKDDSLKGWIFSVIILFVFIKFIFFPFLSLATGSSLPLAIVESCSMYHDGNIFSDYEDWWQRHEIKYGNLEINQSVFNRFRFKNGLNKGDIIFIAKVKPAKLKIGDIITFNGGQKNLIIHRIINITQEDGKYVFSTIGDNNNGQLSTEIRITEDKVDGKVMVRVVPYLGWVKLIFFENSRTESERGLCQEN